MFTKNIHKTFLSETIASQIWNLDENRRDRTSSFFQSHCSAQYLHPDRGSGHVSIVRWWELWKLWEVFPPQGSSAGQPRPVLVKVWRWNLGSQDHLDHFDHLDHLHDLALQLIIWLSSSFCRSALRHLFNQSLWVRHVCTCPAQRRGGGDMKLH